MTTQTSKYPQRLSKFACEFSSKTPCEVPRKFFAVVLLALCPPQVHALECETKVVPNHQQLIFASGQKQDLPGHVQSRFAGPLKLKVWRHWQPSWNVENLTKDIQFELIRGADENARPYVLLRFLSNDPGLRAEIRGKSFERQSEWAVAAVEHFPVTVQGETHGAWTEFKFTDADAFYDVSEKRVVTDINFQIFRGDTAIYHYSLQPMFHRGRHSAYWNNAIDAFSAHAGAGAISVATMFNQGLAWDRWQNTPINPVLNYIERNSLETNSIIGLHRHESHQEVWFNEQGRFVVYNGVAQQSGAVAPVTRTWNSQGTQQLTDEFDASGGWIEARFLEPGDFSMVVPSSDRPGTVYFHGIKAVEARGVFWTMGAKN